MIGGNLMDKKTTGILAYITWIGFFIALIFGDREGAKFHINQALVLNLFSLISSLSWVPIVGIVAKAFGIFCFICWLVAFVGAVKGEENEAPLLGKIKILR